MRPLTLIRPQQLDQVRKRVADDPGQRVIRAGGLDLLDQMKEGLLSPQELVELRYVSDTHGLAMRGIQQQEDQRWAIGALVTLSQVANFDGLPPAAKALREAAGSAATPGIRNTATVGGNLLQRPRCWYFRRADLQCLKKGGKACLAVSGENKYHAILGGGPSFIVHPSTLAVALTALGGVARVVGDGGTRELPMAELFVGPKQDPLREHSLAAGEVITQLLLPALTREHHSAYEVAKEKHSHDWPLAEAAVSVQLQAGKIAAATVVLGHVAPVPWKAAGAEQVLVGQPPSAELFAQAAQAATTGANPLKHNAYKVPLSQGLVRKALHRACNIPLPE